MSTILTRTLVLTLTLTLSSLASASTWGLGSSWSIGTAADPSSPSANSAFGSETGPQVEIVKVETTFTPGTPPSGQLGELILWPGLSNGTGDLLQTTVESWPDQAWCGGSAGDWCIRTSVYTASRQKHDGAYAALPANTPVKITFERAISGNQWTQSADVNNKVVSNVMSASGPMTLFGIVTQCDDYCAGTIAPQSYINTTITLSSASPTWGGSVNVGTGSGVYGDGTTASGDGAAQAVWDRIESDDGGKSWKIGKIEVGSM